MTGKDSYHAHAALAALLGLSVQDAYRFTQACDLRGHDSYETLGVLAKDYADLHNPAADPFAADLDRALTKLAPGEPDDRD